MTQEDNRTYEDFDVSVLDLRKEMKKLGSRLMTLKAAAGMLGTKEREDRGEVFANLMLSYRHLEDASMRLGKVLQYRDGGVSAYDKSTTMGPTGEPLDDVPVVE